MNQRLSTKYLVPKLAQESVFGRVQRAEKPTRITEQEAREQKT